MELQAQKMVDDMPPPDRHSTASIATGDINRDGVDDIVTHPKAKGYGRYSANRSSRHHSLERSIVHCRYAPCSEVCRLRQKHYHDLYSGQAPG